MVPALARTPGSGNSFKIPQSPGTSLLEQNGVQVMTWTSPKFTLKSQAAKFVLKTCKDVFVMLGISFTDLNVDRGNKLK